MKQIVERNRILGRHSSEPSPRGCRQTIHQHALLTQRREMIGNGVGHLPAEPLHGGVIEVERRRRTRGHGGDREVNRMILATVSTPPLNSLAPC